MGQIAITVGGMVGFLIVAFVVGQRVVDALLRRTRSGEKGVDGSLTVTILVMLAFCVFGQALGVEAVLGAFVAGILLGRSRFQHEGLLARIESLTMTLFAPLFFATAGLRVDLSLLGEREVLLWSIVVILVASGAKFLGSFIGARVARLSFREGAALGAGLNARGAMEVVIAPIHRHPGLGNRPPMPFQHPQ